MVPTCYGYENIPDQQPGNTATALAPLEGIIQLLKLILLLLAVIAVLKFLFGGKGAK